jgi:hypothetical protein
MLGLLLVSGITASVVGYKVKRADIDRKAQLLAAYELQGGSFAGVMTLSSTTATPNDYSLGNIYRATYELNERARKVGLYATLETTPAFAVELALLGLEKLGSTECLMVVREAWQIFQNERGQTASGGIIPSASRIAKRYDRAHARDVEVKLFKLLTENRAELSQKATP